jgi:Domain of unknown function (DUF4326)
MDDLVVNIRKSRCDVFVGRPSIWGNPYSHLDGTSAKYMVASRDEAIQKYEEYIMNNPKMIAKIKRELRGKVLGCFCAPRRCHAEILARIANE